MIYNMAGNPKSRKSLFGWLKYKVGEPPVLLSKLNLDYNTKVLQNTLENQGYFRSICGGDTAVKNKKAEASYKISSGIRIRSMILNFLKIAVLCSDIYQKHPPTAFLKRKSF